MRKIFSLIFITLSLFLQAQTKTKNIVLITLDGLRWQEVFQGADSELLNNKEHVRKTDEYVAKYWRENASERREILMPFFWNEIAKNGQIYGNRNLGSNVNVTNPYWFSYPGYNELLCGFTDEKINSNEFGPNPNTSVLEFINNQKGYKTKVAAFTSWDAFTDILNEKRSGVLVNAAFENLDNPTKSAKIDLLNKMQYELPDVFYGVRLDAATFNLAFEYMKINKPNFLFIGLDETDDFAHFGGYDYYLNSAQYSDKMIRELWQWIQSDPNYKDQTSLVITCDHGRGIGSPAWKSHGTKTENSSEIWFAVIGPDTPATGEIMDGQYYMNQLAKTMAALMGLDYSSNKPVGNTILNVLGK